MSLSARENAIGLYLHGIRDGRPREAVAEHTGARYIQHSTGVRDGRKGFIEFFEEFIARNPDRDIRIVRSLQDGPKVFIHAHQILNGGESEWITTDFFDSDAEGKIIEHWDVIEAGKPANPSDRSKVDGPTEITDPGKTEANKAVVRNFVETCLIGRQMDRMAEFIDAQKYLQHNPDIGDGLDTFLSYFTPDDCPLSYQECFMAVGEGNFVATLNRARWGDQDLCQVDLFRLDAGKIVEHWDNSEPVPRRSEWVNSGKF